MFILYFFKSHSPNEIFFFFFFFFFLQLKDGGKASQANVRIGDVVLSIDGISAQGMTHLEAQNKIKGSTGSLNMTLQR